MIENTWEKMRELTSPLISTAMHDIYNEINNLFALLDSIVLQCKCLSEQEKLNIERDFFEIIAKTKARQFLFMNIWSTKLFTPRDFKTHVERLNGVNYTINTPLPLSFLVTIFLLCDTAYPINIMEDNVTIIPKYKFALYLKSLTTIIGKEYTEAYFLQQCESIKEEQENNYLCNVFLLNIQKHGFNYFMEEVKDKENILYYKLIIGSKKSTMILPTM